MNVQLPKGWNLAGVEIAHEKFPRPLTAKEIKKRASYAYPARARRGSSRASRPVSSTPTARRARCDVATALVRAKIALVSGPGSYWVLVYAAPGAAEGKMLSPITAVRILAD